mgnify:CR=1 FL=1
MSENENLLFIIFAWIRYYLVTVRLNLQQRRLQQKLSATKTSTTKTSTTKVVCNKSHLQQRRLHQKSSTIKVIYNKDVYNKRRLQQKTSTTKDVYNSKRSTTKPFSTVLQKTSRLVGCKVINRFIYRLGPLWMRA